MFRGRIITDHAVDTEKIGVADAFDVAEKVDVVGSGAGRRIGFIGDDDDRKRGIIAQKAFVSALCDIRIDQRMRKSKASSFQALFIGRAVGSDVCVLSENGGEAGSCVVHNLGTAAQSSRGVVAAADRGSRRDIGGGDADLEVHFEVLRKSDEARKVASEAGLFVAHRAGVIHDEEDIDFGLGRLVENVGLFGICGAFGSERNGQRGLLCKGVFDFKNGVLLDGGGGAIGHFDLGLLACVDRKGGGLGLYNTEAVGSSRRETDFVHGDGGRTGVIDQDAFVSRRTIDCDEADIELIGYDLDARFDRKAGQIGLSVRWCALERDAKLSIKRRRPKRIGFFFCNRRKTNINVHGLRGLDNKRRIAHTVGALRWESGQDKDIGSAVRGESAAVDEGLDLGDGAIESALVGPDDRDGLGFTDNGEAEVDELRNRDQVADPCGAAFTFEGDADHRLIRIIAANFDGSGILACIDRFVEDIERGKLVGSELERKRRRVIEFEFWRGTLGDLDKVDGKLAVADVCDGHRQDLFQSHAAKVDLAGRDVDVGGGDFSRQRNIHDRTGWVVGLDLHDALVASARTWAVFDHNRAAFTRLQDQARDGGNDKSTA